MPGKSGCVYRCPQDYVRKGAGNKQLWAQAWTFGLFTHLTLAHGWDLITLDVKKLWFMGQVNMSSEVYLSPWKTGRVHVKFWICWYPLKIRLSDKPILSRYSTVTLTFLHSLHPIFFNYESDPLDFPCLALFSLQLNWGWLPFPQRVWLKMCEGWENKKYLPMHKTLFPYDPQTPAWLIDLPCSFFPGLRWTFMAE